MPSEFDDFMDAGFGEASEVIGKEEFTISGKHFTTPRKVRGSLNELGTVSEVTLAGEQITFSSTLLIALAEFANLTPRQGQTVTRRKDGRTFRIVGDIQRDSLAITVLLQTVHQ